MVIVAVSAIANLEERPSAMSAMSEHECHEFFEVWPSLMFNHVHSWHCYRLMALGLWALSFGRCKTHRIARTPRDRTF